MTPQDDIIDETLQKTATMLKLLLLMSVLLWVIEFLSKCGIHLGKKKFDTLWWHNCCDIFG